MWQIHICDWSDADLDVDAEGRNPGPRPSPEGGSSENKSCAGSWLEQKHQ